MSDFRKVWLALVIGDARFWAPILVLFLMQRGFDIATIMSSLSVMYLCVVLLEYPTGVFGDRVSHYWSVVIGYVLSVVSMILFIHVSTVAGLFAINILSAIAIAFQSGSDRALFHAYAQDFAQQFPQLHGWKVLVTTVGVSVGGVLATWDMTYPLYATASTAMIVLALLLSVSDRDRARSQQVSQASIKSIVIDGFRLVREHVILKHVLVATGVMSAFFFSVKWFYNPWFLEMQIPVAWWGFLISGFTLAIAAGAFVAARLRGQAVMILAGVGVVISVGLSGMTWLPFVAFIALFVASFLRGYLEPRFTVVINSAVHDGVRASIFSLESLLIRLGAAGFTAMAGWLIDATAVWSVMLVGAVTMVLFAGWSFVRVLQWKSV